MVSQTFVPLGLFSNTALVFLNSKHDDAQHWGVRRLLSRKIILLVTDARVTGCVFMAECYLLCCFFPVA